MFPILVFMYAQLSLRDEREMQSQFGEAYERYRDRTPRFVPRLRGAHETLKEG